MGLNFCEEVGEGEGGRKSERKRWKERLGLSGRVLLLNNVKLNEKEGVKGEGGRGRDREGGRRLGPLN